MWYAQNIIILHSTSGNLKNSQSLTDLPKTVADTNMKSNAAAAAAAGQITTSGMCIIESNVMYLTRAATVISALLWSSFWGKGHCSVVCSVGFFAIGITHVVRAAGLNLTDKFFSLSSTYFLKF